MPAPSRRQLENTARALCARLVAVLERLPTDVARAYSRTRRPEGRSGGLRRARWDLRRARVGHRIGVLRARVELRRAVTAHRSACRRAERAVRGAEKEAARRVMEADRYLRTVARPRQIASYGPFSLFDNSLRSPDWEVSLASVHAVILPAESAALKGVGSEALPPTEPLARPRRNRLALQGRRGASVHDFPRNDPRARDFAHLVNVAALNAGKFDQQRREDMDFAAERLEEARAWATGRLARARAELEATANDTSALDEARRRLARAQLATGEIEACETRVAMLESVAESSQPDHLPPDEDDLPTE